MRQYYRRGALVLLVWLGLMAPSNHSSVVASSKSKGNSMPHRILILCTGNSCRSQMAEGILRSLDPSLEVYSAGTIPAERVHPMAIRTMKEIGIDISQGKPKSVNQFLNQPFDFVITVCDDADKNCPFFTGRVRNRIHIGFIDPAKATGSEEEVMGVFRTVRDQIRVKFRQFYDSRIGNSDRLAETH